MREMNGIVTVVCLFGAVACTGGATSEETPGVATGISADTLLAATETLASDEFEGRAPGSEGETKTVAFLTEQFSALGLTPGNPDGTWVQDVPLVGITPLPGDNLVVTAGAESRTLEPAVDYVAATKHVRRRGRGVGRRVRLRRLRCAGAEYDWDDFGDTDVSGKILLFLVNDPPLDDIFGGPAMTYYGRWTYKHEIAAELGAAGSMVIHETGPAGYPWEVVGSTPYAEAFDLVAADDNLSRATVEGWVQRATAEALFEMGGLDFEEAKQQAADRTFEPIPLGVTGSLRVRNELRRIDSQNVVAKIEGSGAPDEGRHVRPPIGTTWASTRAWTAIRSSTGRPTTPPAPPGSSRSRARSSMRRSRHAGRSSSLR